MNMNERKHSETMKRTLRTRNATIAASAALALGAGSASAQLTLLRSFSSASDGAQTVGTLSLAGSELYGMASSGGSNGYGTVFNINTDGNGFTLLRTFIGGDGRAPYGSLTLSDSTLYGLTSGGGISRWGNVFRMNTDGSAYTNLHSFANDSYGRSPYGSLTLSGSTLYGMTGFGGSSNGGTIFKLNTDGSGFALLHTFTGSASDGKNPSYGTLTLVGSTLFGMTQYGGSSDGGTVFKMNTNGTGFSLLHSFAGGTNDGNQPRDALTLSGSTLYGMTSGGGSSDKGTVFRMNTDGSGFGLLHSFAGGTDDGSTPLRSLTLSGSTLYGMTQYGGNGYGTVFQINTDGNGFTLLHGFTSDSDDGRSPQGDVTVSGPTLYGLTYAGGRYSNGTAFRLSLGKTITATAGSHGSIAPAGLVAVPSGGTTNFVITPDPYWHIADVATNGTSVGAMPSFTWDNIVADGAISAAFDADLAAQGTPHWWLASFGWTNNFDTAETNNSDSDAFNNGQEYIADTDPTNPASFFSITAVSNLPPWRVYFPSSADRVYSLGSSTNLLFSDQWSVVGAQSNQPGNGGTLWLSDTNETTSNRFYRLKVNLP